MTKELSHNACGRFLNFRWAMTRQRLPQQGPSSPLYAPFSVRAALAASLSGGLVFALVQVVLLWVVRGAPPWLAASILATDILIKTIR